MSGPDPRIEANRHAWNRRVAVHRDSAFYDLASFQAGRSSLRQRDVAEVGPVEGRSLLHLQCHFGQDTLSWARLGARATGADFSETAIELARSLAAELHLDADFICADLYVEAGLTIESLQELPYGVWRRFPSMTQDAEGWWRLPGDPLPLLFSVRASKALPT